MARGHHHFHVEFGLNETPLTLAIGKGDYQLAEEIIGATSYVLELNDGYYENVPLHMVLTNNYSSDLQRNLKLAKQLVQKGANPNLRVPFEGSDRTSPSPFEELVVCYEALRYFANGTFLKVLSDELVEEDDILVVFVKDTIDLDGNLCKANMDDCEKLIEQTGSLIDIFLENGGDPNVITTFRQKSLFHWIVEHDLALGKRFLKTSRVLINMCGAHGNSPLMDAIVSECNDSKDLLCLYDSMSEMVDAVEIDNRNCVGETALFRSCFVGAVEVASRLCNDGAKMDGTTYIVYSHDPCWYSSICKICENDLPHLITFIPSPLLASLLSDSSVRFRYGRVTTYEHHFVERVLHKNLIDKIILSSISPILDWLHLRCQSGHSDSTAVTSQLEQMISILEHSNFSYLRDGRIPSLDLATLMFGQLSAGLGQLCIRTIFDHVLMVSRLPEMMWPGLPVQDFCIKNCKRALMESHMSQLVEMLRLPQSFQIFFDIEAAKYQVCRIIMSFQCLECQQACSESDFSAFSDQDEGDETTDSSDLSSAYGASILFSSDILSEESSAEEVDDLSDEFSESDDDDGEACKESIDQGEEDRVRKKVKCHYKILNSSSEDISVVVETLCEDVAEYVAQQQHKTECQDKYQKLSGGCTDSPTSNNFTSPSTSSESEVKISPIDEVSNSL